MCQTKDGGDVQDRIQAFVKQVADRRVARLDADALDYGEHQPSLLTHKRTHSNIFPKGKFNFKLHVDSHVRTTFMELFNMHREMHVEPGFPL